jgi:hypothetical protein
MTVELECTYCGHKWEKMVYNKQTVESERCPHCNDSNLKVRDASVSKVDTYAGSPPFPPKNDADWNFMKVDGLVVGIDWGSSGVD